MTLALGDIIQITHNALLFGERVSNVYFYEVRIMNEQAGLIDIGQEFKNVVASKILDLQSQDLTNQSVEVENLTNELDFTVLVSAGSGSVASVSASSSVSGGIKLSVGTRLTRPGSKRIGGIPAAQIVDNAWSPTPSAIDAVLVALVDELDLNDLPFPVDAVMNPIVVGRFRKDEPNTGQIDISRFSNIIGAIKSDFMTTQTSRRAGRGD